MVATAVGIGIHRRGGIVEHLGTGEHGGFGDGGIGIMHHQFLAESIDEMLGATGYTDFQGLCLGNGHRVADAIAP